MGALRLLLKGARAYDTPPSPPRVANAGVSESVLPGTTVSYYSYYAQLHASVLIEFLR